MPDSSSTLHEVKISELPVATGVNDTDQLEANQAGTTRSITVGQIAGALPAPPGLTDTSPRSFGAVGDGVTDDTAALQAAINAVSAAGGGNINCTGGRWLIDSANLIVKGGVYLVGPWRNLGRTDITSVSFDYSAITSAFVVNPVFTIQLNFNSGIEGMAVLRKGLTAPTTLRQSVDLLATFAGTGVTFGTGVANAGDDVWISNLFVAGFATGISSVTAGTGARSRIQYITGDNQNGIYINNSFDQNYLTRCHFWPFLTARTNPVSYVVSGAVNNGSGLVRLTIASHVLVTGDRVSVSGVGGVTGALGAFLVTVINPTTIDLQGSVFGGTYTSGGFVNLSAWYRSGVAFNFDGSVDIGRCDTCFSFNYAIGFRINACNEFTLSDCHVDSNAGGTANGDTSVIGILVTGASLAATLVSNRTSGCGVGLKCDSTASQRDAVEVIGHRAWGNTLYSYEVSHGWANFINCEAQQAEVFRIDDAASGVNVIGGDFTSVALSYQSTASPRPSAVSTRGWANGPVDINVPTTLGTTAVSRYAIQKAAPTATDTLISRYYASDTSGAQVEFARENYRITNVTPGAVAGGMFWSLSLANALTNILSLTPSSLSPFTAGGLALGGSATGWANLFLNSAAVINWNNGAYILTQNGASLGTSGAFGVGLGATAATGQLQVRGTGQTTASIDTTTGLGSTAYLQSNTTLGGDGGMVMFGCNAGAYAAIKGLAVSGSSNTTGDVVVSTRRVNTDTTLTETARFLVNGSMTVAGVPTALAATAVGAGAATQAFVKASSTANLGIYYGTGVPSFSAAKGSIYSCTNATTTTTRLYVNTDGAGTWATITTSA